MASLYLLIPVAIIFVVIAVALFLWAVRNRQFDDLDREGQRILFDNDTVANNDNAGANNGACADNNAGKETGDREAVDKETDDNKTGKEDIAAGKESADALAGKAANRRKRGD